MKKLITSDDIKIRNFYFSNTQQRIPQKWDRRYLLPV